MIATLEIDRMEQVLRQCLEEAGGIQRGFYAGRSEGKRVRTKGSAIDLVTEADKAAEAAILGRIKAAFPGHGIVAEESGVHEKTDAPAVWNVDPLDGTTNFAHGMPVFCVSIGVVDAAGEAVIAGVYNPVSDELYFARAGRGATLNGEPICVSDAGTLETSLMVTGFPYDRRERADHYLASFKEFMMQTRGVLRLGSAALDLCQVACGRLDGYYEENLNVYDWSAGVQIVREAGGRVSDYCGGDAMLERLEVCASNGSIHGAMLDILKPD